MLILELLGTFFGAGFASGREIASFFARFGIWGYAGALLASAVMYWLLNTEIPEEWLGKWPLLLWKTLNILLLASTGGAMLSAAGETVGLVLPIPVAAWWGMFLTLALSLYIHRKQPVRLLPFSLYASAKFSSRTPRHSCRGAVDA